MKILTVDPTNLTWTIPCFPVLSVDFQRATFLLNGKQVQGLIKFGAVLGDHFPIEVMCLSSCHINIENEDLLVVWDFTSLHTAATEDLNCENSDGGEDQEEESISDEEDPETDQVNHCLPFKVMGVTYNSTYQKHLEAAKAVGVDSVIAKIEGEPENEHDSNAIAVFIDYGSGWAKIGYIAKELTRFIHPLLKTHSVISIDVKHIKFCIVYSRVGYYITINVTRKGQWEEKVIRASKKVK